MDDLMGNLPINIKLTHYSDNKMDTITIKRNKIYLTTFDQNLFAVNDVMNFDLNYEISTVLLYEN